MTDYKPFLSKLHKNLNTLNEREANYPAGHAPLELVNQIDDHKEAIELTRQAIDGELTEAEWREALQPLMVVIDLRSGEAASSVTIGDIGGSIEHSIIAGRDVQQTVKNVVVLLGKYMPGRGEQLEPVARPTAEAITELVLAQVEAANPFIAQNYPKNPASYETPLSDALAELLEADQGLAGRLDALLAQYETARAQVQATQIGDGVLVQGEGAIGVKQGDQGQVIIGSQINGDVLGPGASKMDDE